MWDSLRQTPFGSVCPDWRLVPLPEYVFFQEGPGLRKWQWTESGMKVINGRNILADGRIDLSNTDRYISLEEFEARYSHFAIEPGDIVVTSSGTIGKVGCVGPQHLPLMMNTSVVRFHPRSEGELSAEYLHSFLRSHLFQNQADSFAIGAAQPNFGPAHIRQMDLLLPPIATQRKIAVILSAYDDLIENNTRRIATLEEMVRLIYREWFVHFRFPGHDDVEMVDSELGPIPDGWSCSVLGDILTKLESGSRPRGGIDPDETGMPSIGAENVLGLGKYDFTKEKYVTRKFFDKMRKGHVESGDVALYKDGGKLGRKSLFRDGFPHGECCVNEHVFLLRAHGHCSPTYLYLWLDLPDVTQSIVNLNSNAAQPGISQAKVKTLQVLLADRDTLLAFERHAEPLMAEMFNLAKQNGHLRDARDLLLPRLVSGEIDVSDLPIDTGGLES